METTDFFKELLEYNFHYNQELIDLLENNELPIPEKSLKLLNHLINAQQIWNQRILTEEINIAVWEIRPLDTLKSINENNYNKSLQIINKIDLSTIIDYKNSKGIAFSNSVRDTLFHVINHSTYHRAQIASDLKDHGIEPLTTDYIFYKRK